MNLLTIDVKSVSKEFRNDILTVVFDKDNWFCDINSRKVILLRNVTTKCFRWYIVYTPNVVKTNFTYDKPIIGLKYSKYSTLPDKPSKDDILRELI